MEDQTVQQSPEQFESSSIKETEVKTEEAEVKQEEVKMVVGDDINDDEEFYERIEAPKFVDFTKPYTVRTDDRYWFCSRVGCDRKHEEEINPEEISKNFVLRVMAARSPNIKLRKALSRDHSSVKCPHTAPAKPSKPRIPRFAMVSLNSHKNDDTQSKTGPCSKVGSARATPVAKSRQVAAKYMTTPRNKVCQPNPNSFRSVQNPKATTVDVPKVRTVAKALVFNSPKKAIVLKKSVELHTPLTKICEGMKRLAIASQKKTLKGTISKPKKPNTGDSERRQLKMCRSEKKSKDLAPLKSAKTQNKKTPVVDVKPSDGSTSELSKKEDLRAEVSDLSNKEEKENMVSAEDHPNEVKIGDGSEQIDDGKENALNPHETSEALGSHALRGEINDLSNTEDKENKVSAADHSNEAEVGFGSEQIDDGKENALNHLDINQPLDDKILSKEMHKKNKVVQTAAPGVTKCKKPKPTSVKPFRLRTDERGILKEAILEKKLHIPAPKKETANDNIVIKKTYRAPKNENVSTNDNSGKESGPNPAQRRTASTQQRSMTSLRTRSQRAVSPRKVRMPGQQLGVIDEKSSKLPSDVMVEANKSRAVSAARSTSRGKRPVTVAKEPNFHTSHLPRTCSKNIA